MNFWGNNEYGDGFTYENWGGYNLLVKLNQHNPEVKNYICGVIRFWVSEFDIDGIRLDAADVLDFGYMQALRQVANEVKPEFWLMGEVIHGDYNRWVNEGTLHSVTNYHLHKALYSGCNDHNFFEIAHTVKRLYGMGGNRPDGLKLYNFADNHDVERIYTKLQNKAHYVPVHIMMYTLPGIPSIYYGSEFGIEGKKERGSDDSLRPALKLADYKDAIRKNECTKLVAALGWIRQSCRALSYGDYTELKLTTRQYAYSRSCGDDYAIIAVNNDDSEAVFTLSAGQSAKWVGALGGETASAEGGNITVTIAANSGEIFVTPEVYGVIRKAESDAGLQISLGKKAAGKAEAKAKTLAGKEAEAAKKKAEKEAEAAKRKNGKEAEAARRKAEKETQAAGKAEAKAKALTKKEAEAEKKKVEKEEEAAKRKNEKEAEATKEKAQKATGIEERKAKLENKTAAKKLKEDQEAAKGKVTVPVDKTYEEMTVEELQAAVLEKLAKNGPVTDRMRQDVAENVYHDSLVNWVKSFR